MIKSEYFDLNRVSIEWNSAASFVVQFISRSNFPITRVNDITEGFPLRNARSSSCFSFLLFCSSTNTLYRARPRAAWFISSL